ncbi:hypothetical protein GCM10023405_20360 [Streptomonospora salina]
MPAGASLMFPVERAVNDLPYGAPQLSEVAPTQYQDYDRAKNEAELRMGIVPALVFLSFVVPLNGRPWVIIITGAMCAVLLVQSTAQSRSAYNILANAAYLDYITIPVAQAVADFLDNLAPRIRPENEGQWIGSFVWALQQRGFFEEVDDALHEMLHLDESIRGDAQAYLEVHDHDSADTFARLLHYFSESKTRHPSNSGQETPVSESDQELPN